jgi:hypothetical protein
MLYSFVISLLHAICTLGYTMVEMSHHIWLFEWKSMKVFELLCLSIATIWMKLNVIIWIHHWMYIHWVKLIFCITFNFGFSKIFRIKEPIVLWKILNKPSLFSQNNEQITFPSFIKAYLTIFKFYEICDYRSKFVFRFWVIVVVYFETVNYHIPFLILNDSTLVKHIWLLTILEDIWKLWPCNLQKWMGTSFCAWFNIHCLH